MISSDTGVLSWFYVIYFATIRPQLPPTATAGHSGSVISSPTRLGQILAAGDSRVIQFALKFLF